MTDNRLTDIEIKLSRQEDLLDTLNDIVYRQQKKITELEGLCAALARQLQSAGDASGEPGPMHELPPHY